MKYISDIDYSYIMNDKYPKERFSRKDDAFSEATGLSPDEIYRMIPENDRKYYSLSLLSATFDSSVARARDAIGGGALYNDSILLFGFLADVSDSLMMIKKYVYERGE